MPNKKLNNYINDLRKNNRTYIFTNASNFHANRVLNQLGLDKSFDGILTIQDTALVSKPKTKYFEIGRDKFDINFEKTIFFEDSSHNLISAKHLGMQTVLVHADDHKSEANFYDNQEIDYYVADVESFFEGIYSYQEITVTFLSKPQFIFDFIFSRLSDVCSPDFASEYWIT